MHQTFILTTCRAHLGQKKERPYGLSSPILKLFNRVFFLVESVNAMYGFIVS